MSHSLVEIPYSEWSELLHLYKDHKKYSSSYSLILNYINWIKNDPGIDAKIYGLDGEWKNDGTFILIDPDKQTYHVYFNTLSDNTERLNQALTCLDTSQAFLFFAFQDRLLSVFNQHLKWTGFDVNDVKIDKSVWYHLGQEDALQFDIRPPDGITVSPLDKEHVCSVDEVWPHRSDISIEFVERLIQYNDSIGAFDKDGNLVAWCCRLPLGSLGLVQVVETHQRKGLGSLVVRNLSRIIALKGEEVFAPVVFKNVTSRAMFEKLGFHRIDHVYWAFRSPK